jgi:restriction system protein
VALETMVKGWTGELKTKLATTLFLDLKEYHVYNNVLIKTGLWTSQIDHVIVSRYGIFVIETKNRNGWIFGKADENYWTQINYNKKVTFQNPLKQNHGHTQSLAKYLKIDNRKMYSVVVFWGDCRFKTIMPANVLNNNFSGYVKSKRDILLSDSEIEYACQKLQRIKDNTSVFDGWRHSMMLQKRFHHN